jgi:hypothetical protein
MAVRERLLFALRAFKPDLILLSAGFDGSAKDIGNQKVTGFSKVQGLDLQKKDYLWLTQEIRRVAGMVCNGRIVSVLEGGYGSHHHFPPPRKRSHAQATASTTAPNNTHTSATTASSSGSDSSGNAGSSAGTGTGTGTSTAATAGGAGQDASNSTGSATGAGAGADDGSSSSRSSSSSVAESWKNIYAGGLDRRELAENCVQHVRGLIASLTK